MYQLLVINKNNNNGIFIIINQQDTYTAPFDSRHCHALKWYIYYDLHLYDVQIGAIQSRSQST